MLDCRGTPIRIEHFGQVVREKVRFGIRRPVYSRIPGCKIFNRELDYSVSSIIVIKFYGCFKGQQVH